MLSDEQLERYSRQLLLADFDVAGQERLLAAKVLVVGLGGLGAPAALYLAAAGVGTLVLADGDRVERNNLQRQIAHGEADLDRNKAGSCADAIAAINSGTSVRVVEQRLEQAELDSLAREVDLVVDATDNFPARFAINRACIAAGIPMVSGAAVRAEGQVAVFDSAAGGPCYRCLYPVEGTETALSCSESGVLAPLVGVIGSLQAMEALKVLSGFGEPLRGHLLVLDLRSMDIRRLVLPRRPGCPDCAQ